MGRSGSSRVEDLEAHIEHVHGPEQVEYALDELIVVCLVRDGRPYVRSFIEHYFSLGVKHIVFLDNGSVDGTIEVACSYENVTVLRSDLPFKEHKLFMKRYLVERFGRGRWCLYVDIDELFEYPYSEVVELGRFLSYLTERSYTAVVAQMLDMFPEEPVLQEAGREDEPLKELHRFYDVSSIVTRSYHPDAGASNMLSNDEIEIYRGGIHNTLFDYQALLTKHPLMFVDDEMVPMNESSHWVARAHVADVSCVLLHYKFIGDFHERALLAVGEENYANDSFKHKKYLSALERENLELRIKRETARELESADELVHNGFLVVSRDYMALVVDEERKKGEADGGLCRLIDALKGVHASTKAAWDLERQVQRLERQNGDLKERNVSLLENNRRLRHQMREIQDSTSFRLLSKLDRVRARIPGRKGQQ